MPLLGLHVSLGKGTFPPCKSAVGDNKENIGFLIIIIPLLQGGGPLTPNSTLQKGTQAESESQAGVSQNVDAVLVVPIIKALTF